jgi:hypothetical protein
MKRIVCTLGLLAAACSAQSAAPAGLDPIKLGSVTFSGSLRSRVEAFDWFHPSTGDNAYGYSGNILRFSLSQKLETWDWNAEFAVPFLLGLPSDATAPAPQGALGLGPNYFTANNKVQNTAMIFPKQLYVRFTQFGKSKASMLKIGRFEFLDGSESTPKNASLANLKANRVNQRLIGSFSWSDVGRSFDGMQYTYSKPAGTFTFFGSVPTRGVFQVDGWGWNKSSVGYTSFSKNWGTGRHSAETRVMAIYYDDWRPVVKTDNRPAAAKAKDFANVKIWTVGGNSLHAIATGAGPLDFLVWGVEQGGKWGVQDHNAYAFDVEGGWQPKVLPKLKPWLRGGYSIASGDANPNDSKHNTFFQILPTPRPYAKFPFYNMMNNVDRFAMLTLRPHAKVTLTNEFHALALASATDLWYAGGGVFQPQAFGYIGRPTGGNKSLANLYDMGADYRMNARLSLAAYYGYAQGRAAMKFIYPNGEDGSFGYLEATIRF